MAMTVVAAIVAGLSIAVILSDGTAWMVVVQGTLVRDCCFARQLSTGTLLSAEIQRHELRSRWKKKSFEGGEGDVTCIQ